MTHTTTILPFTSSPPLSDNAPMTYLTDSEEEPHVAVDTAEDSTPETFGMFRKKEESPFPKFNGHELESFLEDFTDICSAAKVTSNTKMYKALLQNCIPRLARDIKGFPSYPGKDYNLLLEELNWFYGEDPREFDIFKVRRFTAECRHNKICNLQDFKNYHQKYLILVGQARAHKKIS